MRVESQQQFYTFIDITPDTKGVEIINDPKVEPRFPENLKILEKLGQGGMGAVYKAVAPDGTLLAVKVAKGNNESSNDALPYISSSPEASVKLSQKTTNKNKATSDAEKINNTPEIDSVKDFKHVNSISDWDSLRKYNILGPLSHHNKTAYISPDEVKAFYVMEYVDGENLGELQSSLTLEQKLDIYEKYTRSLTKLHQRKIINRDVKPDNIMIGNGEVYMVDLGLCKQLKGRQKYNDSKGFAVGTLAYIAPEAAQGKQCLESDTYSMALTILEGFGIKRPSTNHARMLFLAARTNDDLKLLKELKSKNPDPAIRKKENAVFKDLKKLLAKALAHKPENRLSSIELLHGIKKIREEHELNNDTNLKKKITDHQREKYLARYSNNKPQKGLLKLFNSKKADIKLKKKADNHIIKIEKAKARKESRDLKELVNKVADVLGKYQNKDLNTAREYSLQLKNLFNNDYNEIYKFLENYKEFDKLQNSNLKAALGIMDLIPDPKDIKDIYGLDLKPNQSINKILDEQDLLALSEEEKAKLRAKFSSIAKVNVAKAKFTNSLAKIAALRPNAQTIIQIKDFISTELDSHIFDFTDGDEALINSLNNISTKLENKQVQIKAGATVENYQSVLTNLSKKLKEDEETQNINLLSPNLLENTPLYTLGMLQDAGFDFTAHSLFLELMRKHPDLNPIDLVKKVIVKGDKRITFAPNPRSSKNQQAWAQKNIYSLQENLYNNLSILEDWINNPLEYQMLPLETPIEEKQSTDRMSISQQLEAMSDVDLGNSFWADSRSA